MSPLFNVDSKGVCARYETLNSRQLDRLCSIDNPYSDEPTAAIQHAYIPISELTHYYKADNYLAFGWNYLTLNLNRNSVIRFTWTLIYWYLVANLASFSPLLAARSIEGFNS
ncbi:hypothetical protein EDC94DRAFT_581511 [Helicostylum pulchrum]|nr:hypothetical protein EDC94DRAFT_581511 [Helicostylum pulchrum]